MADTGIGIDPEFIPHVFDRFRQTDSSVTREFGGLGVGLAIVARLVELHGGAVEAHSDGAGRGSTFTVRLPVSPVRPESGRSRPAAGVAALDGAFEATDLTGVKVLVVEDEQVTRELLDFVLSECHAEVLLASDAAGALVQVQARKPDVLICDIGLPTDDGYELLRRLRALGADSGGGSPPSR